MRCRIGRTDKIRESGERDEEIAKDEIRDFIGTLKLEIKF